MSRTEKGLILADNQIKQLPDARINDLFLFEFARQEPELLGVAESRELCIYSFFVAVSSLKLGNIIRLSSVK